MASDAAHLVQTARDPSHGAAMQHRPWRSRRALSSGLERVEQFLSQAGFDRGPWVAVALAAGIALWFALDDRWQWLGALSLCVAAACGAAAWCRSDGLPYLRQALIVVPLVMACGLAVVWAKSATAGARPIERPVTAPIIATLLERQERPAERRIRLVLATREPESGRAIRVRVNLPSEQDTAALSPGARLRLRVRLMPPSPPMLPGGYDFGRAAWFGGLAGVGNVLGKVEVLDAGGGAGPLDGVQAKLSAHVRAQLSGSAGAIAAALASGDRGAIAEDDDRAMRDAGLAHLLSISGLHVSAVVAAAYVLALRLLALSTWLALRVRLPLLAAGAGAAAGVGYTLLTGAEVPTVRSCIGAVLVLGAMALGREPLSLRMIAVAAIAVMLFWPEAVVGPSFQMSFAAVIGIVALHGAAPIRAFLAPREEGWWMRLLRQTAMLLLTGIAIELALMPIGLFHFHRAGLYGAFANVIAIPLTTVASMPLIAAALVLDVVGAGAPAWWLAGKSIELMLALAHFVSSQPGSVTTLPPMGSASIMLFVAGGLWLALWRGPVRLAGILPLLAGAVMLAVLRPPDLLVTGDGRHVGITDGSKLYLLREAGGFSGENLSELAGMDGQRVRIEDWPGARCNRDFCVIEIARDGREWSLLLGRGRDPIGERALAAACARADIVIADRWLPRSCMPRVIKIDRRMLARTGGVALDLETRTIRTVAAEQGEHGWWRVPPPRPYPFRAGATRPSEAATPDVASPSANASVSMIAPQQPR